jgi:hypothetical protein
MNRLILLPLLLVPACNKDSNTPDSGDSAAVSPVSPQGRIGGVVTDQNGNAVEGVIVSLGDITATTKDDGSYMLVEVDPGIDLVIKFSKRGYASNYKVTSLLNWETVASNATLLEVDGSQTISSFEDSSFIVEDTSVEFKANSFIDKENGVRYNGVVTVEVTHVDPSTAELSGAPRDLSAISNSNDSQLVSYGMVDVSLFGEDGQELSLDLDKPANLRIPITNGSLPSGLQLEPGDTQKTWSYDPTLGTWVEEAQGTISGDEEGLYFSFEAPHFSWWNCDMGFVPSCAEGRVIDVLGFPVRGADVTCAGGQTTSTAVTDENGEYSCSIMVGDYVSFTGRTFVANRSWHKTKGSIFMDSEGSSAAECEPIPDIQIDVCRIAGAINIENYDAVIDINNPESKGADSLSAVFWDPPGDIEYCQNPWESLHVNQCWYGTNDELVSMYPESAFPGIPDTARSAGGWVEVGNDRHSYRMPKSLEGMLPFYNWDVHDVEDGRVTDHRPDFVQGDIVTVQASGDASTYFGPWSVEEFATVPNQVYFSEDTLTANGGSLTVDYGNRTDGEVFFAAMVADQQVLCKFDDDGGFNVPASALSGLEPGWGGASVFNLSMTVAAGPDGLPIYAQVFSGETVPLNVE